MTQKRSKRRSKRRSRRSRKRSPFACQKKRDDDRNQGKILGVNTLQGFEGGLFPLYAYIPRRQGGRMATISPENLADKILESIKGKDKLTGKQKDGSQAVTVGLIYNKKMEKHSMSVIIDPEEKIIELFEPGGALDPDMDIKKNIYDWEFFLSRLVLPKIKENLDQTVSSEYTLKIPDGDAPNLNAMELGGHCDAVSDFYGSIRHSLSREEALMRLQPFAARSYLEGKSRKAIINTLEVLLGKINDRNLAPNYLKCLNEAEKVITKNKKLFVQAAEHYLQLAKEEEITFDEEIKQILDEYKAFYHEKFKQQLDITFEELIRHYEGKKLEKMDDIEYFNYLLELLVKSKYAKEKKIAEEKRLAYILNNF